ncbi:MAG: DNA-protecting protein DprA [Oceanospirillales bacterium]|nr:MAG: DNA-protecting protein DprA [Oceanospirillales bacterium]
MTSDPREWIAVSQLPGLGPATLSKLTAQGISPAKILAKQLPQNVRLRADTRHALHFINTQSLLEQADKIIEQGLALGLTLVSFDCKPYPSLLKEIDDPPPLLWLKGNLELLSQPQLAIVGSRKPSVAGASSAFEFARSLSDSGFIITSGLAQGIDTAAHKGAIKANKPTLAVLGTSPEIIYPRVNQVLADHIVANGGLLVSEFPPNTKARPENFPKRNRIISGLSVGTLVVEAALRSGSLITARLAMEQGREVFAIPGSIHNPLAKGCHALIREGALLVENTQQICEPLAPILGFLADQLSSADPETFALDTGSSSNLTDLERTLLQRIQQSTITLDQLHTETSISVSELQQMLINLQLDGKIDVMGDHYMALC